MRTWSAAVLLAIAFPGCDTDNGGQRGRYSHGSDSSSTYGRVNLNIVTGEPLGRRGGIIGPRQTVLVFAILLPIRSPGSGGAMEAAVTRSTWKETLDIGQGRTALVDIEWDRVLDRVLIDGRWFDRSAGNVFLIEVDERGKLNPRQNARVRSALIDEAHQADVIKEEFPHVAPLMKEPWPLGD